MHGGEQQEGSAGLREQAARPGQGPVQAGDVTALLGTPLGYPAAVEAAGLVVAPLLAGFTFAVAVLVLQEPTNIRWADAALALLVAAGLVLVLATQFALATKRFAVTPEQWLAFRELSARHERARVDNELYADFSKAAGTREATRLAHNLGLALFFGGVAVSLVPHGDVSTLRWLAIGLAGLACLAELGWAAEVIRVARGARVKLWRAVRTALESNFSLPGSSDPPAG